MNFALIGKNIVHSKSPEVYEKLLGRQITYQFLDYPTSSQIPPLRQLLEKFHRISVTAPYKNFCYDNCDKVSSLGKKLEAVNALAWDGQSIVGENTDALGVRDIFKENYPQINKVLLLGDGAMARVVKACAPEKTTITSLSRKLGNLKDIDAYVQDLDGNSLIINSCSRDYRLRFKSTKSLKIWDLNYSVPLNATFAKDNFHSYTDGEELLIRQARYALSFWNSYIS